MNERKHAATKYFSEQVLNPCIDAVDQHIVSLGTLAKVAKHVKLWKELNVQLRLKADEIKNLD